MVHTYVCVYSPELLLLKSGCSHLLGGIAGGSLSLSDVDFLLGTTGGRASPWSSGKYTLLSQSPKDYSAPFSNNYDSNIKGEVLVLFSTHTHTHLSMIQIQGICKDFIYYFLPQHP